MRPHSSRKRCAFEIGNEGSHFSQDSRVPRRAFKKGKDQEPGTARNEVRKSGLWGRVLLHDWVFNHVTPNVSWGIVAFDLANYIGLQIKLFLRWMAGGLYAALTHDHDTAFARASSLVRLQPPVMLSSEGRLQRTCRVTFLHRQSIGAEQRCEFKANPKRERSYFVVYQRAGAAKKSASAHPEDSARQNQGQRRAGAKRR